METESNKKSFFNPGDIIWWVCFVVCIGVIAVIAIFLFQDRELPLAIISAVLGVVMTIAATASLFWGQSRQQSRLAQEQAEHQANLVKRQQEGETETEKFKEKLKAYNRFLDSLSTYLNKRDDESRNILVFQTAALGMHTDDENIIKINKAVAELLKPGNEQERDYKNLIQNLFDISDYFYSDLYNKNRQSDSEELRSSVDLLKQTFEHAEEIDDEKGEDNSLNEKEEEELSDEIKNVDSWQSFKSALNKNGWEIEEIKDSILVNNAKGKPFQIRIRKPRTGTYIIEGISLNDDKEFIRNLKISLESGKINGSTWWKQLTSLPSYGIHKGKLLEQLPENERARALVIKWIEKLIKEIS